GSQWCVPSSASRPAFRVRTLAFAALCRPRRTACEHVWVKGARGYFPLQIVVDGLHGLIEEEVIRIARDEAHMRRQHRVLTRAERMFFWERLDLVDVESRTGDAIFLQGSNQCLFLYQRAPGSVDQVRRRLHQRQLLRLDDVTGAFREAQVDADHVALSEQ